MEDKRKEEIRRNVKRNHRWKRVREKRWQKTDKWQRKNRGNRERQKRSE